MEFIKATYHESLKTVEYETENGTRFFKINGNLNWRFNNPGNLKPSQDPSRQPGRIGVGLVHNPSANRFAIFSSIKAGATAKRMLLRSKYKNSTISEMMSVYAPKEDHNDPVAYSNFIISQSGVSPTSKISELSTEDFDKVVKAIEKKEGGLKAGTEKWAYVTNITISDGTMPVADVPFKVTLDKKTYEWKTDNFGRLNTIVHTQVGMSIVVKYINAAGKEDVVYSSVAEEKTKNIVLTKHFSQFSANTLIDQPEKPREKSQPGEIEYVVMSGDTLSKIANRYKVSAEDLAINNKISDVNKIYPGQKIVIYGKKEMPQESYTVKAGDSLSKIAKENNTTVDKLIKDNAISDSNKISLGQVIKFSEGAEKTHVPLRPDAKIEIKQPSEKPKSKPQFTDKPAQKTEAHKPVSQPKKQVSKPVAAANTRLETIGGKTAGNPLAILPHDQRKAPWMAIAVSEAKEWQGTGEKKIQDNYHHLVGAKGQLNSTPWCASFINYCLKESGCDYSKAYVQSSQFPVYDKNKFKEVEKPIYGAIMVFRTYTESAGKFTGSGHVSFVYGKTESGDICGLGGNQGGEKFGGGTIKLSLYSLVKPVAKFKMTVGGVKNVPVVQKFHKFYVPITYETQSESNMLTVVNVDEVNNKLFGFGGKVKSNNDEGGGR